MIPLFHRSDSETMPGLLQKIDNAISNTAPWQKPLILLFEDGDKYNSVLDVITDKYRHAFIISEPKYMTFVTKDNQTECLLNGKTVDAHKPETDLYLYLEGTPLLDIEALNYCIGLFQYEKKPVICMICTTGKDTRIDNFPAWLSDGLEIVKYDDSKIEDCFR